MTSNNFNHHNSHAFSTYGIIAQHDTCNDRCAHRMQKCHSILLFFQRGTITYRLHGGRHELLKLTHKALVSMDCQVHTQLIPVIPPREGWVGEKCCFVMQMFWQAAEDKHRIVQCEITMLPCPELQLSPKLTSQRNVNKL